MDVGVRFRVASGSELVVRTVVKQAKFRSGDLQTWADLLAPQVPYNMILGIDWSCRELVFWDFGRRPLKVQRDKGELELPVVANLTTTGLGKTPACKQDTFEVDKQQINEARRLMVEDVERLGRDDAAALVRPAPKRYKNFKTRKKLVPIKNILKELQGKQEEEEVRPSEEAALALCLVPATQTGEKGTGLNTRQIASLELEYFKYLHITR